MSGCPDEALSALVDGALGHAERDRVLAHLAGCPACRTEVEEQRALKARLDACSASTPDPSAALLQRLHGLAVPGVAPAAPRPAPLPVGRAGSAPPSRRPGDRRPPSSPRAVPGPVRSGRVRRTSTVGGGLLLVGVGLALALGAPATGGPSTPVDPGSDAFVVDFVSTTSDVPLADPAARAALLPRP
jgi:anti-sigma factor RsiW